MRYAIPLIFLFPVSAFAQTKEMIEAIERKLANQRTAKWVLALEAPDGGFYLAPQDPTSMPPRSPCSAPPTARSGRSSTSASRSSTRSGKNTPRSC